MTDSSITQQFVEIPASNRSLLRRKLVYGFGINDATYKTKIKLNNKTIVCPYYVKWNSMIERCYSEKSKIKRPTYIGCTVSQEWKYFSKFRSWMVKQDWHGKQLEKDIIIPNNKVYSEDTCVFVSKDINKLLNDRNNKRGDFPIGVSFKKENRKYQSQCQVYGKTKYLGLHDTPKQAHEAYCKFKSSHITEIANKQTDSRIKEGLLRHAQLLITSI